MKRFLVFVCAIFILCSSNVWAKGSAGHSASCSSHGRNSSISHNSHNRNYGGHSSSSSEHVYLTNTEHRTYEHKFPNCDNHYVVTETITNYYSNGTRNVFSNNTIYNSDGTVIETDCLSVKHLMVNDKHYFIINKKGKGYQIIDDGSNILTTRKYSYISEVAPDRLLVKYDKKYGVIDINENTVIPIKYQQFEQVSPKIFKTKLNGYYGLVDIYNTIILPNNCDKIKQENDYLIVKRYDKYGLTSKDGNLIYDIKYDKIKNLGEYFLIKQNKKFAIYSPEANAKSKFMYNKIKLERNTLRGLVGENTWVDIDIQSDI